MRVCVCGRDEHLDLIGLENYVDRETDLVKYTSVDVGSDSGLSFCFWIGTTFVVYDTSC